MVQTFNLLVLGKQPWYKWDNPGLDVHYTILMHSEFNFLLDCCEIQFI